MLFSLFHKNSKKNYRNSLLISEILLGKIKKIKKNWQYFIFCDNRLFQELLLLVHLTFPVCWSRCHHLCWPLHFGYYSFEQRGFYNPEKINILWMFPRIEFNLKLIFQYWTLTNSWMKLFAESHQLESVHEIPCSNKSSRSDRHSDELE